jgi:hypothetical protein
MTAGKPSVRMTFRVTPGARIRKADAQVLGDTFAKLKSTGPLTAERVLAEATNPRSQLHRYFEWDDAKAAHSYRVEQARKLIRSIEVVIEDAKGKEIPMRAFYSVRDAEGQRNYESMQFVFETPDMADQVVAEALAQLESWKTRYSKYAWARGAIPSITAALRSVKKAKKPAKKSK